LLVVLVVLVAPVQQLPVQLVAQAPVQQLPVQQLPVPQVLVQPQQLALVVLPLQQQRWPSLVQQLLSQSVWPFKTAARLLPRTKRSSDYSLRGRVFRYPPFIFAFLIMAGAKNSVENL
jgi:hypothetical protein